MLDITDWYWYNKAKNQRNRKIFIKVMDACLANLIISFFVSTNDPYDPLNTIFTLMRTNRHIKKLLIPELMKVFQFKSSLIRSWNEQSVGRKYIRHLLVDDDFFAIPGSVTHLTLLCSNDKLIEKISLPLQLQYLKFELMNNCYYLKFIKPLNIRLPQTLKYLIFHRFLQLPVDCKILPNSLTHLENIYFSHPLDTELLNFPSLTYLSLNQHYDDEINFYPPYLEIFDQGVLNKHPLESLQQNTLRELSLSATFNHKLVIGSLPRCLEILRFGALFNHKLDNDVLPGSLIHLEFGAEFDQSLDVGILPYSLTFLDLGFRFNKPLINESLPGSLKTIKFSYCFNQPLCMMPRSLTSLQFGYHFNHPIEPDTLPGSLMFLEFGYHFNQQLKKKVLPLSLTSLIVSISYTQSMELDNFHHKKNREYYKIIYSLAKKSNTFPKNIMFSLANLIYHNFN